MSRLMAKRQNQNPIIIIDISNPRNVEKTVTEVPNTKLYNIDDLQMIADKNKAATRKSHRKSPKNPRRRTHNLRR